jgi:acyl-CoA reductase-like NAD-dependent aldehyde dehydrogenase
VLGRAAALLEKRQAIRTCGRTIPARQPEVIQQDRFSARVRDIKIGDGALPETKMGPLAHGRRVEAMETMISDAKRYGAHINCGGVRLDNKRHFFAPTIICEPSKKCVGHER